MSTATDGHRYLATACRHDLHDQCRETCKYCSVRCGCRCHPWYVDGQPGHPIFLVITADWHFGIDAHAYTDRDEALRVARETAARRAARETDYGGRVAVHESEPPGTLLYLRYSEDGGEIEDSVWVVERAADVPIVDPDCDCGD